MIRKRLNMSDLFEIDGLLAKRVCYGLFFVHQTKTSRRQQVFVSGGGGGKGKRGGGGGGGCVALVKCNTYLSTLIRTFIAKSLQISCPKQWYTSSKLIF